MVDMNIVIANNIILKIEKNSLFIANSTCNFNTYLL